LPPDQWGGVAMFLIPAAAVDWGAKTMKTFATLVVLCSLVACSERSEAVVQAPAGNPPPPSAPQQPQPAPAPKPSPASPQNADPRPGDPGFAAYTDTIRGIGVKFDMVPVPGGTFTMGSPASEAERAADEGPQVQVEVAPFWLEKCEVTWAEYDAWNTDASIPQSKQPDGMSRPTPAYTDMSFGMGRDGFPAICMTNEAARQYCIWLSRRTGHWYRLPTEAEWEYACRAGAKTAYSFGDDPKELDKYAWFAGNSGKTYHKVGQKLPNAWGLFDMQGNVCEWCCDELIADYYDAKWGAGPRTDPYAVPRRNSRGQPLRYPHVARGGSWQDPAADCRAAARRGSDPSWKARDPQFPKSYWYFTDAPFVGFRVVRPLHEPDAEQKQKFERP
jgi:formylglycine-generating enzyme required for sulfatase activity